jgi:hypothetical protein
MTREKATGEPRQADGYGWSVAHGKEIEQRVTQLGAWVEAAMRALASLASIDLEALLTELDEARGMEFDAEFESDTAG